MSITTNLSRYGGAQKVLVDVHNGLKLRYPAKIVGLQQYERLHPKYGILEDEYLQLTNVFALNNKIIIVHARNVIPFIVFLKKILLLNTTIIYVAHNVYSTLRLLTFFPAVIVSISNKVTDNLINYFGVAQRNIHLIYNGLVDKRRSSESARVYEPSAIKILYVARINAIKRQLYLVDCLKNRLNPAIEIHFAGVGEDFDQLVEACNTTRNFKALGFIENIDILISNYDYLMLYSTQEGLPLSLIEGTLHGKPLLVNDIGGNLEIGVPGLNAFQLTEDKDLLVEELNNLVFVDKNKHCAYSTNSRNLYVQKFTFSEMIENYCRLIDNLYELS